MEAKKMEVIKNRFKQKSVYNIQVFLDFIHFY